MAGLADEVDPYWLGGLVLLVVTVASVGSQSNGNRFLWANYLALSVAVPVAVLAIGLMERQAWVGIANATKVLAAAIGAGLATWYVVFHSGFALILLGALQAFAIAWLGRRTTDARRLSRWFQGTRLASMWLVATIAWTAAARLLQIGPALPLLHGGYDLGVYLGYRSIAVLAVVLFATVGVGWMLTAHSGSGRTRQIVERAVVVVVVGTIAWFAFDTYSLFRGSSWPYYHWSLWVGPAEMVRQGHWLLWDVPSEYGFLSILATAALPLPAWESFFLINGVANLISALVVFFVLRQLGGGLVGVAMSLAMVLATQFFRNGVAGASFGPDVFPSTGGYRFVWVMILLALSIAIALRLWPNRVRTAYLLGSAAWIIGALWSVESCAFCSCVWLPTCALIGFRGGARNRLARLMRAAAAAALPLVAVAMVAGAITLVYLLSLGHAPEVAGLWELSGYAVRSDLERDGPVWALLLALVVITGGAGATIRERGLSGPTLALVAAWTALVSTAVYFVQEPRAIAAFAIGPVFVVGAVTAVVVASGNVGHGRHARATRLLAAPLLSVVLIGSFADLHNLRLRMTADQAGRTDISTRMPRVDGDLQALMLSAGVGSAERVAFHGCSGPVHGRLPVWLSSDGRAVAEPQYWIPVVPTDAFGSLSRARQQTYIQRWATRRVPGWLIECKMPAPPSVSDPGLGDLASSLRASFAASASYDSDRWRLTLYRPL
jgi:hypothetical protein